MLGNQGAGCVVRWSLKKISLFKSELGERNEFGLHLFEPAKGTCVKALRKSLAAGRRCIDAVHTAAGLVRGAA